MKSASTSIYQHFRSMCGSHCMKRCQRDCTVTVGLLRDTTDRAVSMYNMWLTERPKYEEKEYLSPEELLMLRGLLSGNASRANIPLDAEKIRWRFSRFLRWLESGPWLGNLPWPASGDEAGTMGRRPRLQPPSANTASSRGVARIRRKHYWPQARHFQVGARRGAATIHLFGRAERLQRLVRELDALVPAFHLHHNQTAAHRLPQWRRRVPNMTTAQCGTADANCGSAQLPRSWRMRPSLMNADLCAQVRRAFAIDGACLKRPLEWPSGVHGSYSDTCPALT
jgi:hypothetical protein